MKKIYFYGNGSFLNKGCEAIARGTTKIIKKYIPDSSFVSISDQARYDKKMNVDGLEENYYLLNNYYLFKRIINRIRPKAEILSNIKLKNVNSTIRDSDLCISLGGDNYCYRKNYYLIKQNQMIHNVLHKKTVLWGCSVNEENIDKDIIEDMNMYDLITVRETITLESLRRNNIINNVKLVSDPAFAMNKKKVTLPEQWELGNTVGLNISPLIINNSKNKKEIYNIFKKFINYLIDNTSYKIALIPHVLIKNNNDYLLLKKITNEINNKRIILIEDNYNAEELKYIISKCNIFIGARTHATIAAYSTCVPTLVIGYSVKSKGIAKDIFGDYNNYVLPIQEITSVEKIINSYKFIEDNQKNIREHLQSFMPEYIEKAWKSGEYIRELIERK